MTYLGQQEVGKLSSIREISRSADVPMPYLAKIINQLSRKRLVRAKRGPSGGVMLGKPASVVTIGDIVDAMDASLVGKECILGLSKCTDEAPCPVHEDWKGFRQILNQSLHQKTVRDLAQALVAKLALHSKS